MAKSDEQKRYVRVVLEGGQDIPDRVPGYRGALESALIEILGLERAHMTRPTTIVKDVTAQIDAVATVLIGKEWKHAGGGPNDQVS